MEVVKGPDNIREEELLRLMAQYKNDLMRMALAFLKDEALAEDAVQETFFKAYHALTAFRGDSSEKTWLMRIAINVCRNIRRDAWFRFVDRRITPERAAPAAGLARGSGAGGDGDEPALPAPGGRTALLLSGDEPAGNLRSPGYCRFYNIHTAEKSAGKTTS